MDSFDDMLSAQETLYARRLPETRQRLDGLDLLDIRERRDALAARFAQAETHKDAWVLASAQEQRQQQRLQAIGARIARLPQNDPQVTELRERQALLSGLLGWSVETDFAPRLWENRKALQALDAQLAEMASRHRSLLAAEEQARNRFQGFAGRIFTQRASITRLQPRVESTLAAHETYLQTLALEALELRRQILNEQILRARYALARLYDELDTPQQGAASP
jgi:hypothetical protein